jgi:LPPG:FO 2-phospho-L-lactate transferase
MTEDPVTTRIVVAAEGRELDLHFQEYWVRRGARDDVKSVRYEGATSARPGPGVLDAIAEADAVVICPSNPVASIGPILAVPGVRPAVERRRERVIGISGIVRGAPLAGMADRLMPVAGVEVTAAGAAEFYGDLLGAWVIDEGDRSLAARIGSTGIRVAVTDTIMTDDAAARALARVALDAIA